MLYKDTNMVKYFIHQYTCSSSRISREQFSYIKASELVCTIMLPVGSVYDSCFYYIFVERNEKL